MSKLHNQVPPYRKRRVLPALAAGLLAVAGMPSLSLAATGYELGAAANYSDNIARVPAGEVEDVVSNMNGALMWTRESARLEATAFTQVSYMDYRDDTFDDELVPRADIRFRYDLIPSRLVWSLEDRFGQIASDPFEEFTPDNIENTNVVRTGPDFLFGSSSAQTLTWSIRAEDQYYEEQDIDNQRLNSTLELRRRISEDRSVALSVYGERVEFENENLGRDYELYEAFLSFEQLLTRYDFSVDAGGTELRIADESVSGVLGRLGIGRTFESDWVLQLTGEYSFTNSGNRFLIGREQNSAGPGQTVDDDNIVAAGSPLRLRMLRFGASRNSARYDFTSGLFWESESFEDTPELDRVQTGGVFLYELMLTPRNSIVLGGSYKKVEFDNSLRSDEHGFAELRLRRQLSQNLSLDLRLARAERTSSDLSREYKENIAGISLSYRSDLLRAMTERTR